MKNCATPVFVYIDSKKRKTKSCAKEHKICGMTGTCLFYSFFCSTLWVSLTRRNQQSATAWAHIKPGFLYKVETLTSGKSIVMFAFRFMPFLPILSGRKPSKTFSVWVSPCFVRFCSFLLMIPNYKRKDWSSSSYFFSLWFLVKRWNHCGKWFIKLDLLIRCVLLIYYPYIVIIF